MIFFSACVVFYEGLQRLVHSQTLTLIGLAITVVILKITWDSWRVVCTTEPSEIDQP